MWCSVALPSHVAVGPAVRPGSGVITCDCGGVPRLKRLVQEICHWLLDRPAGTPAHAVANRPDPGGGRLPDGVSAAAFAAPHRQHFGELPSHTLGRGR